ncbi:30S ribosomal protein S11 [Candidatus Uhrbacteria bacterium]|nr:30S ribosomal protein S11 [Candidatus Uhrbacteria bacterium]
MTVGGGESAVSEKAPKPAAVAAKKPGARSAGTKGRGKKGKSVRQVSVGRVYVHATYNNTIVTLTDQNGNVLSWSSAGAVGFKGPKKSTPYAAGMIVKDAVDKVRPTGLREVNAFVSGIGSGREAAVRALHANGISVMAIKDVTPIPHNGCRPPKPRRI